jgi:hypothetical protein
MILVTVALASAGLARADTPQMSNIQVTPRDAKTAEIRFDLSWPKPVRPGLNHVALWVFFKARVPTDGRTEWRHLRLVADKVLNPAGFGQGSGVPLEFVVPDGKDGFTGMFLRRAQNCTGTLVASNITAVISLETPTTDNRQPTTELSAEALAKAVVRLFAIEMAYVPEGPFYVGSGRVNHEIANRLCVYGSQEMTRHERDLRDGIGIEFCDFIDNTRPYRIAGAGAIPTGRQPGKLWAATGLTPEDGGEIPAAFPNGYRAFYCMRKRILAGQYADFLNTLTAAQAKKRYYPEGNGPEIKRSGDPSNYTYTAASPDALCPFLSWADGMAFAAWAGLRPMTEFEYEKAGQFAATDFDCNGGGGYILERMVSIASVSGRNFAGTHGLGTPDLPADWPKDLGSVVFRGQRQGFYHGSIVGRFGVSDVFIDRTTYCGGWRAARTVPAGDTGVKADPVYVSARPIARLARAMRADGTLGEWDSPFAVLDTQASILPGRSLPPAPGKAGTTNALPWEGPSDLSAKAYLGWDGEALCVAVEVTDDKHFNPHALQDIERGDCVTIDVRTPQGNAHIVLARTQTGVAFHQGDAPNEELAKTAGVAVVRDDAGGVTRYELRLPLAVSGQDPGIEFSIGATVVDADDDTGQSRVMQLVSGWFRLAD